MRYVEKLIAKQCIVDLLAAGCKITVFDGEETTLVDSTDAAAILSAMFTTDEDYLHTTGPIGWVRFIYGNDGWDVINDYTTNLEPFLVRTMTLSEKICAGDA